MTATTDQPLTAPQKTPLLRLLGWLFLGSIALCIVGGLTLNAMGLRVGSESDYRQGQAAASLPVPTLIPASREALPGTTVAIWFLNGPTFFPSETIFAAELWRGQTADGQLAYYIAFDEAGFNQYMTYWFLPGNDDLKDVWEEIRDPRIDLLPGGLVLYADLKMGSEWKPLGLLYELDESGTQLGFRGFTLDGKTITAVPDSLLDSKVGSLLERLSNRALRELVFIDEVSGKRLTIRQIYVDDDRAEVLAVESAPGEP